MPLLLRLALGVFLVLHVCQGIGSANEQNQETYYP